jgi:ubiquinone/menaquinone biosynthesis C-methylase UbiE
MSIPGSRQAQPIPVCAHHEKAAASVRQIVERGKPADYGQEIVKRRGRITASLLSLKNLKVLDFGAGNGAQTFELLPLGCDIVACDVDAADLKILRDNIEARGVSNVAAVLCGKRLPFEDESFDAVLSFQVIEHVDDESLALEEIRRVLRRGGDFVVSVPNKWWLFETHGARLPLLPWNRVPFFSWLPKSIHSRYARARIYRKREIVSLAEEHGFRVIGAAYMTAPMDVVKSPVLQRFLRGTVFRGDETGFPVLATEIFLHCRKD